MVDDERLAPVGYAALGLAYFAEAGLPDYLREVPVEYFGKAFAWLASRPEADAQRIAVMGRSRGGELALLLGATFPQVKAVIAEVPSGVAWGAPDAKGIEAGAWTHAGVALPWVPYSTMSPPVVKMADGSSAQVYTPVFRDSLAKAPPSVIANATFPVEKTQGPVLLLAGADDQLWPSCELAQLAMDRLVAKGHTKQYEDSLVCYEDSGHATGGIPGMPTSFFTTSVFPGTTEVMLLGGTPRGIARAQRDAFERKVAFLAKSLP